LYLKKRATIFKLRFEKGRIIPHEESLFCWTDIFSSTRYTTYLDTLIEERGMSYLSNGVTVWVSGFPEWIAVPEHFTMSGVMGLCVELAGHRKSLFCYHLVVIG
jgi:hypothetical protein